MNERDIFLSALEIEDPADRQAHVQSACAGDAQLLASVEALLASHGQSQFLNTPVVEQMSEAESAETMLVGKGSTADEEYPRTEFVLHGTDAMNENENDDENPLGYLLGFLQPASRPDAKGRLAHYEIIEVLGRGAFGTVLKAFDAKLERVVAIKVLSPEMAATSPARKRFLREARASAAIRHENVVAIHAVEEQPLPYLVMEYIPGHTLQQRLDEKGPLDLMMAVRFGKQIAEGLAAAHEQDLIHRDIKPGNILLEAGVHERIKITDFGLARAADDASMTQSGLIAGTPMYMAPEQALGQKLDQRADLFSLGSVLYQMISGRPPFRATNTLAVLKRVAEDDPRPIQEIIPETPQWLCDIIAKLHAKDPDKRYQSAQEVAEVFADCEEQLKSHARLQDFSKIPITKPARGSRSWKWVAATVVSFLVLALTMAEMSGITHLVRKPSTSITEVAPKVGPHVVPNVEPVAASTRSSDVQHKLSAAPKPGAKTPSLAVAPFDAVQARTHQEAWARHLGIPVEFTNSIGMKFRLIPPGEFMMGSTEEEIAAVIKDVPEWAHNDIRSEGPARKVRISEPFYLGTTEVTVGQFRQFVAATGYKTHAETNGKGGRAWTGNSHEDRPEFTWRHPAINLSESHPVGQLCPADANAFCIWLESIDGCKCQLPEEEQWEYACRAGTVTPWSFGSDVETRKKHGVEGWDLGFTGRAVAQMPANPFGLFDVHGNVREMCRAKDGAFADRGGISGNDSALARSATRNGSTGRFDSWSLRSFRVSIASDLAKEDDSAAAGELADQLLPPLDRQDLVPTSEQAGVQWRYSMAQPGETWSRPDFDDAAWKTALGPFGSPQVEKMRSNWSSDDIWIRHSFELQNVSDRETYYLVRLMCDDIAEVFLNGTQIAYRAEYTDRRYIDIDLEAALGKLLRPGRNTLAVHGHNLHGYASIDAGLIAVRDTTRSRAKQCYVASRLTDPREKLAASYLLRGDQTELDKLLHRHSAASLGVGSIYAADGDWQKAIDVYCRTITSETTDSQLFMKRAEAYAKLNQWSLAKADWRQIVALQPDRLQTAFDEFKRASRWNEAVDFGLELIERKPDDTKRWLSIAPVLVEADDQAIYADFCSRLVQHFAGSDSPNQTEQIIKACLLRANAIDLAKLPSSKLARYLDDAKSPGSADAWSWGARALLALRSNDPESTLKFVTKSEELTPHPWAHSLNLSLLAISHHELRHPDQAREALAKASQLLQDQQADPGWRILHDIQISQILFREAEVLINGGAK